MCFSDWKRRFKARKHRHGENQKTKLKPKTQHLTLKLSLIAYYPSLIINLGFCNRHRPADLGNILNFAFRVNI